MDKMEWNQSVTLKVYVGSYLSDQLNTNINQSFEHNIRETLSAALCHVTLPVGEREQRIYKRRSCRW